MVNIIEEATPYAVVNIQSLLADQMLPDLTCCRNRTCLNPRKPTSIGYNVTMVHVFQHDRNNI